MNDIAKAYALGIRDRENCLRDIFALEAMKILFNSQIEVADTVTGSYFHIASKCYILADDLVKEREKRLK